jgi:hypothetical protein
VIKIQFDISELMGLTDLVENAQKELNDAGKQLAQLTKAHMLDLAQQRMKSRRKIFVEHLKVLEEDGVWIVSLDAVARWTDEGQDPHSLLPDLLASDKAKTGADGVTKYITVPFDHGGKPSDQTPAQANLTDTIKRELRSFGVPFKQIETNSDGSPRLGLLHKFDINDKPLKTRSGSGQGHGPIGEVRQGATGIPWLQGLKIYQEEVSNPNTGRTQIQRSIMTFRVASSKHMNQGRWDHPGVEEAGIFRDTENWVKEEFDRMAPDLMRRIMDAI